LLLCFWWIIISYQWRVILWIILPLFALFYFILTFQLNEWNNDEVLYLKLMNEFSFNRNERLWVTSQWSSLSTLLLFVYLLAFFLYLSIHLTAGCKESWNKWRKLITLMGKFIFTCEKSCKLFHKMINEIFTMHSM
jgi:hypothetical protein